MAIFITIGYGDQAGYDRADAAAKDAAHRHDAELQRKGILMGIAGSPVQVRNPDGAGVETVEGPFLHAPLPLAGFGVLEADTLEEAIALASRSPCAVAYGVIEVWPLQTA